MLKKMTLVSTIIPAFNAESYIGDAIESALAQSHCEQEVIVVDDGSTDRTLEIAERFVGRVRILHQSHGGPYTARNLGVSMAKGDWIALLDADDLWEPDKLEKQLELADSESDVIYTDRRNFGVSDHVDEIQSDGVRLFDGDVFAPLLLGNFITLSSAMIRRSVFTAIGGFSTESRGIQDWDLWLRLSEAGRRFRLVPEALTRYRWHESQMSMDLPARALERVSVVQRALQTSRGRQLNWSYRRKAIANAWTCSAFFAEPVDRMSASKWYLRSLLNWPLNLTAAKGIARCALKR